MFESLPHPTPSTHPTGKSQNAARIILTEKLKHPAVLISLMFCVVAIRLKCKNNLVTPETNESILSKDENALWVSRAANLLEEVHVCLHACRAVKPNKKLEKALGILKIPSITSTIKIGTRLLLLASDLGSEASGFAASPRRLDSLPATGRWHRGRAFPSKSHLPVARKGNGTYLGQGNGNEELKGIVIHRLRTEHQSSTPNRCQKA